MVRYCCCAFVVEQTNFWRVPSRCETNCWLHPFRLAVSIMLHTVLQCHSCSQRLNCKPAVLTASRWHSRPATMVDNALVKAGGQESNAGQADHGACINLNFLLCNTACGRCQGGAARGDIGSCPGRCECRRNPAVLLCWRIVLQGPATPESFAPALVWCLNEGCSCQQRYLLDRQQADCLPCQLDGWAHMLLMAGQQGSLQGCLHRFHGHRWCA